MPRITKDKDLNQVIDRAEKVEELEGVAWPEPQPEPESEEEGETEVEDNESEDDESFTFTSSHPPEANTTASVADLTGFKISEEEEKEARKHLEIPAGVYRKSPASKWSAKVHFDDEDKKPGDKSSNGRLLIDISGRLLINQGQERFFFVRMSPDQRFRVDRETKREDKNQVDNPYIAFWQAKDFYNQVKESSPEDVSSLVTFLCTDKRVLFRVTQSKNGGNFFGGFREDK